MRTKCTTRLLVGVGIPLLAGMTLMLLAGVALVFLVGGYLLIAHHRPVPLASPTGTYPVGRVRYDWVDTARTDTLADRPSNSPRRLAIWIWYPATLTAASRPAPYLPAAWLRAQNNVQGLQRLSLNNLLAPLIETSTAQSHAYTGAPMAASQSAYPVLILQPGLGPAVPDYTVYAENLASHGYVVVGVNETDSSNLVVFADGQVARATAKGTIPDNATAATAGSKLNVIGRVWTDDAIFVMNKLQGINADASSMFYRRLDLTRIGLFGHSFGGATAIAVCQRDTRCKAGADLDGTPIGDTMGTPVPRPFLFLSEEYPQGCPADENCRQLLQAYQRASGPAYFISIAGSKHFNFSDVALHFTTLGRFVVQQMGVIGSISPEQGLAVSNAYLVAFFDRYLKGVDSPMLHAAQAFPGAQVTSKP